jgi:acyl carrier protein
LTGSHTTVTCIAEKDHLKGFIVLSSKEGKENENENKEEKEKERKKLQSALRPGNLTERLKKWLPSYMIPNTFVLLSQLPLSPNGKIDLTILRQLPSSDPSLILFCSVALKDTLEEERESPTTILEKEIAGVFQMVLGLKEEEGGGSGISLTDNFFTDLGGTSLSALKTIAILSGKLRVGLAFSSLIAAPTIKQLAELISNYKPSFLVPLISRKKENRLSAPSPSSSSSSLAAPSPSSSSTLFLCAPGFGSSICFLELSNLLEGKYVASSSCLL